MENQSFSFSSGIGGWLGRALAAAHNGRDRYRPAVAVTDWSPRPSAPHPLHHLIKVPAISSQKQSGQ
jgi:hypothetical protein